MGCHYFMPGDLWPPKNPGNSLIPRHYMKKVCRIPENVRKACTLMLNTKVTTNVSLSVSMCVLLFCLSVWGPNIFKNKGQLLLKRITWFCRLRPELALIRFFFLACSQTSPMMELSWLYKYKCICVLLTLQEAGEITLFSLETKSLYSDKGWGGQREREFVGTGMVVLFLCRL